MFFIYDLRVKYIGRFDNTASSNKCAALWGTKAYHTLFEISLVLNAMVFVGFFIREIVQYDVINLADGIPWGHLTSAAVGILSVFW